MSEGLAPIREGRKTKNGETPGENFILLRIPIILHSVILLSCNGLGYSSRDTGGSRGGSRTAKSSGGRKQWDGAERITLGWPRFCCW
jgi:hypothetical protein